LFDLSCSQFQGEVDLVGTLAPQMKILLQSEALKTVFGNTGIKEGRHNSGNFSEHF